MPALLLSVRAVQGVEQSGIDEGTWPNHSSWPNEELANHSSEGEANYLRRQAKHDLVTESPVLVENETLCCDDVRSISATSNNVCHNRDKSVFFDVERSRVEAKYMPENPETSSRKDTFEEFATRK